MRCIENNLRNIIHFHKMPEQVKQFLGNLHVAVRHCYCKIYEDICITFDDICN